MRKVKTFKAGVDLRDVSAFACMAADQLTGGDNVVRPRTRRRLPSNVRVTVETVAGADLAVGPVLAALGLASCAGVVARFLSYRRDEKRTPVRSVAALRRLLSQFEGQPDALVAAVAETERQGWTGLFPRGGVAAAQTSRADKSAEGGSNGGAW